MNDIDIQPRNSIPEPYLSFPLVTGQVLSSRSQQLDPAPYVDGELIRLDESIRKLW